MSAHILKLQLRPKQLLALRTRATEVLYGGAADGGARILTHLEDKLASEMA